MVFDVEEMNRWVSTVKDNRLGACPARRQEFDRDSVLIRSLRECQKDRQWQDPFIVELLARCECQGECQGQCRGTGSVGAALRVL